MPELICVAAIDDERGLATDTGMPSWVGKLPTDYAHYHSEIDGGNVLMGYGTYIEFDSPDWGPRKTFVASSRHDSVRPGFELVKDARKFLQDSEDDVWIFGGTGLYETTLDLATGLHLTQIEGTYGCTKFFPPYKDLFRLATKSDPITENGITYCFETWEPR